MTAYGQCLCLVICLVPCIMFVLKFVSILPPFLICLLTSLPPSSSFPFPPYRWDAAGCWARPADWGHGDGSPSAAPAVPIPGGYVRPPSCSPHAPIHTAPGLQVRDCIPALDNHTCRIILFLFSNCTELKWICLFIITYAISFHTHIYSGHR